MNKIEKAIEDLKGLNERSSKESELFKKRHGRNFELAIEALEKQLNSGWIPVSEGLPENQPSWIGGTTYIITLKNKFNNTRTAFAKYKELKWIGDFGRIISDNEVIAWQPLPKAYKEEKTK